jgi:hypothetical protein
MRLFWVFFGLAVVLLVPFLIWGEALVDSGAFG